jgi:hypothetical protein
VSDFARIPVTVIELDCDTCQNTYGIAPCTAAAGVGNECYNTFKTCQDKPNYVRGTKTYQFVTTGAPTPAGETLRPYIKAVKFAPTEIDPDAGIARRASVSVTMFDEPCPDMETDLYAATRAQPAGGTFWSRFFARNHNYSGRWARLRRAYLTGAWNWGDFTTELYQIEAMKGPSSRDEITLTLKDPLKFTDRVKVPRPTAGKLAVALGTSDLQMTLGALDGGDYPASGYVRVGDQVIRYADKKVAIGWNFSAESEGWVATNATVTHNATSVTLTPSAVDPQWAKSSGISFAGGNNRYVHVRLKRVSGTASWEGRLYYATSGHGFSGSYYKDISEPAGIGAEFVTATWDMSALTAGGTDWMTNDITGLRLDVDSGSSAVYEIDWITYSDSAGVDADVLAWPDSTYRSQFGTTAVAAKIGDGVQLCQAWVDVPFSEVVQDILKLCGIDDSYIDLAGLATEESTWLGAKYRVTACLVEPEDASALLGELTVQANAAIWWHPVDQKAKFKVIGPQPPSATVSNTLTDEANLIEGSVQVTPLDDLRLTFAGIYYDIATATANRKEAKSYLRGDLYIDADAESANEYGDRRQDIKYSRWFTAANASAMKAFASRRIAYYRDVPKKIEFRLDAKDAAIEEGDLYDITTDQIVDFDGNPETVRALITKREDRGGDVAITARTTVFAQRYAFIAPAGAPDYLAATEAQRGYAYICNSSGKMSNGDDGYLII